jgi:hypothetical protein
MIDLALYLKAKGIRPRQVQDFIPTPMSMATAMYHTGHDPFTREPVYTARDLRDKKLQKALLLYWDPAHHPLAREALRKAGRADLIGHRPGCLIPPEGSLATDTRPRVRLVAREPPAPDDAVTRGGSPAAAQRFPTAPRV